MQKVVGSNPIARSIPEPSPVGRGTQVAKGEVCKTSIRRFESDPRLHFSFSIAPIMHGGVLFIPGIICKPHYFDAA
jgi:hypothetical protein